MIALGKVLKLQRRWLKVDALRDYTEIGIRSYGRGIFHKSPVSGASLGNKRVLQIEPGDLVFMNVFAWEGAVAVAGAKEAGKIGSHRFATYTPIDKMVDPRFLQLYFRTPGGRELLGRVSPGSAGRNRTMNLAAFAQQPIPLPPIEEQRRIVARIGTLASKIAEGQQVHDLAVEETERLLIAARHKIFTSLHSRIPARRLGDVADSRLGKMLSGNRSDTGTPYLRNANVQWDALDLSSVFGMDITEEDQVAFSLAPGDILVCEGGDIGKAAVWSGEIPGCIFQKALHRVRIRPGLGMPRFLLHHIFWAAEQGQFAEVKTQTTIAHLTGVQIKRHPVYFPDIAEQRLITTYLDGLSAKAEVLRHLQHSAAAELDALLPSILDRAFKGNL